MSLQSNPFATRYTRPGVIDYRFGDDGLDQFVSRLSPGKPHLIVGPHGTGKTTLLHTLVDGLRDSLPTTCFLKLDGVEEKGFRRLRARFRSAYRVGRSIKELPKGSLLILDGIEQLGGFYRTYTLANARRKSVTVLATSHRPLRGMSVVYCTSLHPKIIQDLIRHLLQGVPSELRDEVQHWVQQYDLETISNLRDFWFELYDLVQPKLLTPRCSKVGESST